MATLAIGTDIHPGNVSLSTPRTPRPFCWEAAMDGDVQLDGNSVKVIGDNIALNGAITIDGGQLNINVGNVRILVSGSTISFMALGGPLTFSTAGNFMPQAVNASSIQTAKLTVDETLTVKNALAVQQSLEFKTLKFNSRVDEKGFNKGVDIGLDFEKNHIKKNHVKEVNLTDLLADMLEKIRILLLLTMDDAKKQAEEFKKAQAGAAEAAKSGQVKQATEKLVKLNPNLGGVGQKKPK
jgi:hypothetical protein